MSNSIPLWRLQQARQTPREPTVGRCKTQTASTRIHAGCGRPDAKSAVGSTKSIGATGSVFVRHIATPAGIKVQVSNIVARAGSDLFTQSTAIRHFVDLDQQASCGRRQSGYEVLMPDVVASGKPTRPLRKENDMSVAKVIEICSDSPKSFEDAIEAGIREAQKTLKNIRGAWVETQKVELEDGRIVVYRVNLRVTFVLE